MNDHKIRMRTRSQEGQVELQVLITHPMETGQRKDKKTGAKIPAKYIQQVLVEHNGKVVTTVNTGPAVSEDPLMTFRLKTAKDGDKIKIQWLDNTGQTASQDGVVKL